MTLVCEPRMALLGPELAPTEGVRVVCDDAVVTSVDEVQGEGKEPGLLIPGFIDAHVHIGFASPADVVAGGVTTVRDLGWPAADIFPRVVASHDDTFAGPTILATGPMLTTEGGYPTRAGWAPPGTGMVVADEESAAMAVAHLAERGACAIKVALNAAAGPTLPLAILVAIVSAAHMRRLKVTGHITGLDELVKAIEAGVDELAHMLMSDETIPDELIQEMVQRDMTVVPTLSCRFGHGRTLAVDNLSRFIEAGGRVVYGTDLGNDGPRPGIDPLEVTAMAEAGMSSLDIIRSATVTSAAWLGLTDRGYLAAGMRADLVLVPLEALHDPLALTQVRRVIRGPKEW